MLIKPRHSLQERLLFGKPLHLDTNVAADGKPVIDAREQVDLVRLLGLEENLLGPVALFRWEDGVRLRGGDRQRSGDGSQLVLLDKGWMCDEADVDSILVMPDNILSNSCKFRATF